MKTYNSSDLTHKRAEVLKEARESGVLIQEKRTNGEIIQEYVLIGKSTKELRESIGEQLRKANKDLNNNEESDKND